MTKSQIERVIACPPPPAQRQIGHDVRWKVFVSACATARENERADWRGQRVSLLNEMVRNPRYTWINTEEHSPHQIDGIPCLGPILHLTNDAVVRVAGCSLFTIITVCFWVAFRYVSRHRWNDIEWRPVPIASLSVFGLILTRSNTTGLLPHFLSSHPPSSPFFLFAKSALKDLFVHLILFA